MSSRTQLSAPVRTLSAVQATRLEVWITGAFVAIACSLLALVLDQWLANLAFYGASRIGGLWLVGKLAAASTVAGLVLLWGFLRWRGASRRVQVLGPPAWLVVNSLVVFPRAQVLVLPLFVALLWIVVDEHTARGRRVRRSALSVVAILAILVLWANLHGSNVMAIGLTFGYAAYRCVRDVHGRSLRQAVPWAWSCLLSSHGSWRSPGPAGARSRSATERCSSGE
jgi:hypothetical protein